MYILPMSVGKYVKIDNREEAQSLNILYIHTHDSGRVLGPYGYAVPKIGRAHV